MNHLAEQLRAELEQRGCQPELTDWTVAFVESLADDPNKLSGAIAGIAGIFERKNWDDLAQIMQRVGVAASGRFQQLQS